MDRQAMGRAAGANVPRERVSYTLDSRQPAATGLGMGALIATLDGMIPVEFLNPGERMVTRAGLRVLRAVSAMPFVKRLVRVAPGALGHDRPGQGLLLGAETQVLLRDWRAQALFGQREALIAVERLVDGQFVTRIEGERARLYTLMFDAPEVIYADGVEIGCGAMTVSVGA